jgi:hypothetical protein
MASRRHDKKSFNIAGVLYTYMLFAFEGPSCMGKTTVMNRLKDRNPEWVIVNGPNQADVGIGDMWMQSWQQEHRHKLPIYRDNPDTVFLANRPFSEAVYAYDEETRYECLRVAAVYEDAAQIMYFDAPDDVLEERGMTDPIPLSDVRSRYRKLTSVLPTQEFNTDRPRDVVVTAVEVVIKDEMGR